MRRRSARRSLVLAAALGLLACSRGGEPAATTAGPDAAASASGTAASAKTVEQAASAAPSADAAISPEPYVVMMEEIGAIHTRHKSDCPKLAKELGAYLEAHEAEIRAPDKKVSVAIDADPAQKARMKAAMTAVMGGSARCRSDPGFTKLMEDLRGGASRPNP